MKKDLKEIDRDLTKYFKNLDIEQHELVYFFKIISHYLFTAGERILKCKNFNILFTEPECFSLNFKKEPRVSCFGIITENHIFCKQTLLVTSLLNDFCVRVVWCGREHAEDAIEDWDDRFEDVKEWWLITPILGELLKKQDEIVIDSKYGTWWGRKSCIYLAADEVLAEISAKPETLELLDN